MTSPSTITWIDREKLSSLAEGVALAKSKRKRVSYAGGGAQLLRTLGTLSVETTSGLLAGALPEKELKAPALPFSEFRAPRLPLGQRLNALMAWMTRAVQCNRVFLSDADGLPLAQHNANVEMIGLSAVLSDASRQLSRHLKTERANTLRFDLVKDEAFYLLELSVKPHHVALGFQTRANIDKAGLDQIADAVANALNGPPTENTGLGEKGDRPASDFYPPLPSP
ncbi:MAG: hypothetical protein SNJ52_02485 [Verrucomicrobiia bacterium]